MISLDYHDDIRCIISLAYVINNEIIFLCKFIVIHDIVFTMCKIMAQISSMRSYIMTMI
jgi:hypothetical protein